MQIIAQGVEQTLQPHIQHHCQIAVAYSGGIDSTVLLHSVKAWYDRLAEPHKPALIAIHVNHQLSPYAASWQQHCQQVCQQLNIPLVSRVVCLTDFDQGIEAEARRLRYLAIGQAVAADALVLTGQHLHDQLETFLLQLKRGAGPKGLCGMAVDSRLPFDPQPASQRRLLRPLLQVEKSQIIQYAQQQQLQWVEDDSNSDPRYDRNYLRHQVIAPLCQRWPSMAKTVQRSMGLIAEQQILIEEISAADLNQASGGLSPDPAAAGLPLATSLDLTVIRGLSASRQQNLLRYWFEQLGLPLPSYGVMQSIVSAIINGKIDADPVVQWAGVVLRRYRQQITVFDQRTSQPQSQQQRQQQSLQPSQQQPGIDCALVPEQLVELSPAIGQLLLTRQVPQARVKGLSIVQTIRQPRADETVTVRFDPSGLRCHVAGAAGKPAAKRPNQRLKNLFKDVYHIPPWLRQRTPLVFYNEQLAAVAGLFVCREFAINADDTTTERSMMQLIFTPYQASAPQPQNAAGVSSPLDK